MLSNTEEYDTLSYMSNVVPPPERQLGRSAKPLVVGIVVVLVGYVAYMAAGMPGMDHGSSGMSGSMEGHSMGVRMLEPAEFEPLLTDPSVITLNVHVPVGEVSLPGTDFAMPYDAISARALPQDRDSALAVYCRSGAMSASAVRTLQSMGYTNIAELDGGTDGWVGSGRSVGRAGSPD
jgi:phage shock protein E